MALDSWRGICAILVLLHHTNVSGHLYGSRLIEQSWLFVDFFFVLSGFVVSHAYHGKISGLRDGLGFLTKRLSRLWPLHLFVLTVMVIAQLGLLALTVYGRVSFKAAPFTGLYDPLLLVPHVLLMQALPVVGVDGWNGPAWSISVEFWTYASFAVLLSVGAPRYRIALGLAVTLVSAAIIARWSSRALETSNDLNLIRCFYGFGIGYLSHALWRAGLTRRLRGTAMEIAFVGLGIALLTLSGDTIWTLLLPPAFALVVLTYAAGAGSISRILVRRPFVFLGEISFSVYLIHFTIIDLCSRGVGFAEKWTHQVLWKPYITMNGEHVQVLDLGSPWLGDLSMALIVIAVVALATLTFRFVEKPNLTLLYLPAGSRISGQDRVIDKPPIRNEGAGFAGDAELVSESGER